MSTAARKARKRANIPFVKKEKTPTPVHLRSYVTAPVPGPGGTHLDGRPQRRSEKKIKRYLDTYAPIEDDSYLARR